MTHRKVSILLLTAAVTCMISSLAHASVGLNASGWNTQSLGITGGEMAVSDSGLFAIAHDNFSGGATIDIYDKYSVGRQKITTVEAPSGTTFGTFGGLVWVDNNTLAFTENSQTNAAWSFSLASGTVSALTDINAIAAPAQIAYAGGNSFYVVNASSPGTGGVSLINNGQVTTWASSIGTGYLGGIAVDASGKVYVGDTNDPFFTGNSGNILELGSNGQMLNTISLAAAAGSGCSSVLLLSDGSLLATTGNTIAEVVNGVVTKWGQFDGNYDYGYGLTNAKDGSILVNGSFATPGSVVAATPAPEPASLALLCIGITALAARRRKLNA